MTVEEGGHFYSRHAKPLLRKLGQILVSAFRTLLPMTASIFDHGEARYWQGLPLRRMTGVLLALFFTFAGIAFFLDVFNWWSLPLWALLVSSILIGGSGVAFFAILRRRPLKFFPLLAVLVLVVTYVMGRLPHGSEIPITAAAHKRIALDAVGILVASLLGYRFFLRFINVQGAEEIRARTKLELAHSIQRILVPPIACITDAVEVYGTSMPSEEVGGDLVDFLATESGWLGCVVDVSGHGIAAGVLMGNLKTALRFGLVEEQPLPTLLDKINRVLPAVKSPEAYATLAVVRLKKRGLVEYSLAGHLPILHYRAADNIVSRCGMEQFPLGLMPECNYESATEACETGDAFALLSDGVVETEDASGSQFGLERVENLLTKYGSHPLEEIATKLMTELSAFGTRSDDQSLLLIRMTG